MKTVLFNDLQRENIQHAAGFQQALRKVLKKGWLILGGEVVGFEKEFAKYIGMKYGIGVASGTDALILSLLALNLRPDDEVAIPVNVYPVAFAAAAAGVKIRLIDIEPGTLNMDPADLLRKATRKTKAVILVHLFGRAANIRKIRAVAKHKHLTVIEDCSQAHGTLYHQKKTGSFGDISCFSFYPTKNLGALGDGGIILTNSKALSDRLRSLRQYGEISRYESRMMGRVSRLDEVQAAFLRVKLKKLNRDLQKRAAKAKLYLKNLASVSEITLPTIDQPFGHTFHLFVIQAKDRDALQQYLTKQGIQTGIHYPHLIHRVPSFAFLKGKDGEFKNAVAANKRILSLPFYPGIPVADIRRVCQVIKAFYR